MRTCFHRTFIDKKACNGKFLYKTVEPSTLSKNIKKLYAQMSCQYLGSRMGCGLYSYLYFTQTFLFSKGL